MSEFYIRPCTSGRIGALRATANMLKGRRISGAGNAMVVPGPSLVRQATEQEGLCLPSSGMPYCCQSIQSAEALNARKPRMLYLRQRRS